MSFTKGISSDHRALLFVNLDVSTLLSSMQSLIAPSSTRALHSGNPAKVDEYSAEIMKCYKDHRIFKWMNWLKQQSPHMTRKQVRSQLNEMCRAILHAENQLHIPPCKYAWSPPTCARLVCYSDTGNPVWLTSTRNQIATAHMPRFNNDCSSMIVDTNYPPQMT